jgi:hypothetical protein
MTPEDVARIRGPISETDRRAQFFRDRQSEWADPCPDWFDDAPHEPDTRRFAALRDALTIIGGLLAFVVVWPFARLAETRFTGWGWMVAIGAAGWIAAIAWWLA